MDTATHQFVLYLLFLIACFGVSKVIPPLLVPQSRRENPWVAVQGGRDINGDSIDLPAHTNPEE